MLVFTPTDVWRTEKERKERKKPAWTPAVYDVHFLRENSVCIVISGIYISIIARNMKIDVTIYYSCSFKRFSEGTICSPKCKKSL